MQKLKCFSRAQKNDIKRLLKLKTKIEGGHHIYQVMPSRADRLTPDQSFERKFYPVWALMEAVGLITLPRLEGGDEDTLMVSHCSHPHCVNPDHMGWVMKGKYRATFHKELFDHPSTVWTKDKISEAKRLRKLGTSYANIAKVLGIGLLTVRKGCKKLGI